MLLAGAGFKNEEDAKKWVPALKRTPAANPEWPIDPQPALPQMTQRLVFIGL